jgi:hypothetical protein
MIIIDSNRFSGFSIFNNAIRNEDQITELLNNFLHFKEFRNAFLSKFLPSVNVKLISENDLLTQQSIHRFIPDLILRNDVYEVFFEVKVGDAELQPTQKKEYHEHLLGLNKSTFMCFIVPSSYHELAILQELQNVYPITIIFWEEVMALIANDEHLREHPLIAEFFKFLNYWFEDLNIAFTQKQIALMNSVEIPTTLMQLFSLIEQVKRGIQHKNVTISKTKTSEEHGFLVRDLSGNDLFFYGIWYSFWKKSKSPICVGLKLGESNSGYVNEFRKEFEQSEVYKGWHVTPLLISEPNDELVKEEVTKLLALIDKQLT